ncbi:MAG TPA: Hsp20/alpha crystallin family protein [Thermoplasmata archaeon]|nr:Hsp20/alpha crystallin family protein [Thermoplasmata archaeon]HIH97648.1 Hsp20/alpha crystallin family protein [Thermoplasmata archaeon]
MDDDAWDEWRDRLKKGMRDPYEFFRSLGIDEEDFEKIFEEAERIMEHILNTPPDQLEPGRLFTHGFSVKVGPDGKPKIEMFGNRPTREIKGEPTISEEREPLTDIIEGKEDVSITVEIPGVEKNNVDLRTTEDTLEIKVDAERRKYHKVIDLPCKVLPKTTKATYKNGILDVVIKRSEKDNTGFRVSIQ